MARKEGYLGNEEAQKRLRANQKLAETQAAADLKELLSVPAGRRFIWALATDICKVNKQSFTGELATTSYQEGMRSVGIHLLAAAEQVAPEQHTKMILEAFTKRADDELHRRTAENLTEEQDAN